MSATLRHDIPLPMAEEIAQHSFVLNNLGSHEIDRWAGHRRRGYNRVCKFAIKLPGQIGDGFELLKVLRLLSRAAEGDRVSSSAWTLVRKLTVSFGLPFNEFLGQPCADEKAFLDSIENGPAETATWSAYSDWLVENGSDPRGIVIAEWLDPKKPVKTKYGVPVSVRYKLGLS